MQTGRFVVWRGTKGDGSMDTSVLFSFGLSSALAGAAATLWLIGQLGRINEHPEGCIWQAITLLLLLASITIMVMGLWPSGPF